MLDRIATHDGFYQVTAPAWPATLVPCPSSQVPRPSWIWEVGQCPGVEGEDGPSGGVVELGKGGTRGNKGSEGRG